MSWDFDCWKAYWNWWQWKHLSNKSFIFESEKFSFITDFDSIIKGFFFNVNTVEAAQCDDLVNVINLSNISKFRLAFWQSTNHAKESISIRLMIKFGWCYQLLLATKSPSDHIKWCLLFRRKKLEFECGILIFES